MGCIQAGISPAVNRDSMDLAVKRSELKAHIAKVAARLFYEEGIHAVGVDRIADEAQITKRTLYHHYPSKDQLIAAALRVAPMVPFPIDGPPEERIIGAFEMLAEFLTSTKYRGCPYIIFTAELVERGHPARQIVERRIAKRRAWFRDMAHHAGARDPDLLSEQLDVLFDGALASGTKRGDLMPARAALSAAKTLLSGNVMSRYAESDDVPTFGEPPLQSEVRKRRSARQDC
jgi:AcrR family transcriptional regulator